MAVLDQRQQHRQNLRVDVRLVEGGHEPVEQPAVARQRAGVEEREQEFGVVGFEPGELLEVAHLMADHDAKIPERIEEAADEGFVGGAEGLLEEQQQIDVGMQAQFPAPVPAERDDRHRLRRRGDRVEQLAEEHVHALGITAEGGTAADAARRGHAQLFARRVQHRGGRHQTLNRR